MIRARQSKKRSRSLSMTVSSSLYNTNKLTSTWLMRRVWWGLGWWCRNGGMCMHDEATTHYIDIVDQTTLGHRFIKEQFSVTPRVGWQVDAFGHSAVQAYLLGAEVGFDSLFFGRIDYQDGAKRRDDKSLEFIWQASKSLGTSAQIFSGAFPKNYEPPTDNFYYEVNDESPIVQDNIKFFDYNVRDRVDEFVSAAVAQANVTRTNHVMWTMGTDFKYQYARTWFRQMDKLIYYVNQDGRVNSLYSTPSIYTSAKHAANESWPLKTEDFFPYADAINTYWTGFLSSRPALKGYVRMMSGYYLAARQLEYFNGRAEAGTGPSTDSLGDALAILQHHDAVSGTEQQHVADDYAKRLSIGHTKAEEVVAASFACLVNPSKSCKFQQDKFQQCPLLNISYCPPSEINLSSGKKVVIVVYNPLGWKREDVVRIPVVDRNVAVRDSDGQEVTSQLLPIPDATISLRSFYSAAYLGKPSDVTPKYWLAFTASVAPLGFNTYIISRGKAAISERQIVGSGLNNTLKIGSGNLQLVYSGRGGKLVQYNNSKNMVNAALEQSYCFYAGDDGFVDLQVSYFPLPTNSASLNLCNILPLQKTLDRPPGHTSSNQMVHIPSSMRRWYVRFFPMDILQINQLPLYSSICISFAPLLYIYLSMDRRHNNGNLIMTEACYSEQVPFTVFRGPVLDEVHQRINSWIYQITRVYKEKEHAEVEFAVGPIPIDDGIGKEVVTRITTTMRTNKTFYTDSNGRDFLERVRDFRKDWDLQVNQPVAGNYYPINLGIYMKDDSHELSILVDRSVGGSSIVDGQLELMVHRRLFRDDLKGIAEALNETVCVLDECIGLTVVRKYYLRIDPSGEGARWR
ncbi:alpha-mannosidase At3g26720-like [Punica granatum]|uniref:Alpha-mannosidase n=1 Tax=Punica granatum TaxID=22663 RepID=A0A6P8CAY3_PUNGR|nr:alpha-mannosidase At3g26720-like [Punica granatum]